MTISAADIAVKTAWKIPLDKWEQMPDEERALVPRQRGSRTERIEVTT